MPLRGVCCPPYNADVDLMKKLVVVALLAGISLGAQSASFTDKCFLVMCSVQASYGDA